MPDWITTRKEPLASVSAMPDDSSSSTSAPSDPGEAIEPSAFAPQQRYKLTIAYDGTHFHGWQKQHPPGHAPLRTVQGVVEQAIQDTLRRKVNLVGASRTDSGVHALGQVAQFDAISRVPVHRLASAINSRLPDDVEVRQAELAPPLFDAISSARRKQYTYRIFNALMRPLTLRHVVHHCPKALNVDRMNEAARRLVGTHDVAGLAQKHHGRTQTIRTLFDCHVTSHTPLELAAPVHANQSFGATALACDACDHDHSRIVQITVEGDGFLYNMVRIIAGTLLEVGRGAMDPQNIDQILSTQNRRLAGPTLPPQGLCLMWVQYHGPPTGDTPSHR